MADEAKIEVPVTEAPDKDMPEGDAPFKSTDESTVETPEKSTEITEEAEVIANAIKPGEENETEESNESEVERILREADGDGNEPTNVQKRIDKLTARIKELEAEKTKEPKTAEEKVYTEEELAHAMMKAVEENNPALMRDVIAEIKSGVKKELVKMYSEEKETGTKQAQAIEKEWQEVVNSYKKYSDPKLPSIWPNSQKDLDITSATSLLYQVAVSLYKSKDPEKANYYKQPGGQKLAVADALTYLIRTKAGRTTDTKVKKLEKQLTKERMKKSPVSGVPSGEDKPTRGPRNHKDTLDEVIEERKKFQEERSI